MPLLRETRCGEPKLPTFQRLRPLTGRRYQGPAAEAGKGPCRHDGDPSRATCDNVSGYETLQRGAVLDSSCSQNSMLRANRRIAAQIP